MILLDTVLTKTSDCGSFLSNRVISGALWTALAHIHTETFSPVIATCRICLGYKTVVSNSDQLLLRCLSDHGGRDEHFFSLFQVL